jgi:excisionase family DNA binding protein
MASDPDRHRVVPKPGGRQQEWERALVQTTEPEYLRTAQVAELLQVSPKTVSRWAQEGMLPYVRTLGGTDATPTAKSGPCCKLCPNHPWPASHACLA